MARDDVAPLAVREARRGTRRRGLELRGELLGRGRLAPSASPIRVGDLRVEARDRARRAGRSRRRRAPRADRPSVPARRRARASSDGLEPAAEIEDDVGLLHGLHVVDGQLVVVRLDARRREVRDRRVTADLLGGEGERIEGRDDAASSGAVRLRTAADTPRARTARMRTILSTLRSVQRTENRSQRLLRLARGHDRADHVAPRGRRRPPYEAADHRRRRAHARVERRHRAGALRTAAQARRAARARDRLPHARPARPTPAWSTRSAITRTRSATGSAAPSITITSSARTATASSSSATASSTPGSTGSPSEHGFVATGHRLEVAGLCADCR